MTGEEQTPNVVHMNMKSRNGLQEEFDYQIHERPRTQENLKRRRR